MHGRKRSEYKARLADPKTAAGMQQKALQWNTLVPQVITMNGGNVQKKLELLSKLLRVNPDPMHLYNARRLLFVEKEDLFDIETELSLTQACLERNPKAYGAWFHRKWSLRHALENDNSLVLLEKEFGLVALFLKYDERNFHCWNYRRFLVSAMAYCKRDNSNNHLDLSLDGSWNWKCLDDQSDAGGIAMGPQVVSTNGNIIFLSRDVVNSLIQQEWDFCNSKIAENFSNGSAFHYKSKLLPLLLLQQDNLIIQEELELIHNAVFTEPDDQTPWWYLRFLLLEYAASCENKEAYTKVLEEELETIQELVETENGKCKWGLLALHFMHSQLNDNEKAGEYLEQVAELDPDRAGRYQCIR